MPRPLLLLSTCGTSLLTNTLRSHPIGDFHGGHLNALSNHATLEAIEAPRRAQLVALLDTVKARTADLSIEAAARASAELNGITKLEGGLDPGTLHYLLATDTYVGRQTAGLVKSWLTAQGQSVSVFPIEQLTTHDSATDVPPINQTS